MTMTKIEITCSNDTLTAINDATVKAIKERFGVAPKLTLADQVDGLFLRVNTDADTDEDHDAVEEFVHDVVCG